MPRSACQCQSLVRLNFRSWSEVSQAVMPRLLQKLTLEFALSHAGLSLTRRKIAALYLSIILREA